MKIHLQNLSFFCHHGLHKEEQIAGGNFVINLEIEMTAPDAPIVNISETVNYAVIYELVKTRMMQPTPLLETIVMELADLILAYSPLINEVNIQIIKEAAPILNFTGKVGVSFSKQKAIVV